MIRIALFAFVFGGLILGAALAISPSGHVIIMMPEKHGQTILPVNTSLPVISGIAQVGQTLTATTGAWTHNPTA